MCDLKPRRWIITSVNVINALILQASFEHKTQLQLLNYHAVSLNYLKSNNFRLPEDFFDPLKFLRIFTTLITE